MQTQKEFNYAVFIGRFQPIHKGHLNTIRMAYDKAEKLIIVIGSYQSAPSTRQPWSAQERIDMIKQCLTKEERKKTFFIPIRDRLYDEFKWNQNLINEVFKLTLSKSIALIGHNKDSSSYYLKNFPNWQLIETGNFEKINSTDFRESYFTGKNPNYNFIPNSIKIMLKKYRKTKTFQNIKEEYLFVKNIKKTLTQNSFTVANALVVCGNYILLVRRKHFPGKNLFALPGGHVENQEEVQQAALRELMEETNIELNEVCDLKNHLKNKAYFDYPERNPIARYYAHVFYYKLNLMICPKVTAGDDAQEAIWVLLDELSFMENKFFSDHYQIIRTLLG